jgi:hypothetical protein
LVSNKDPPDGGRGKPVCVYLGFFGKIQQQEGAAVQILLRVPRQEAMQRSIRSQMSVTTNEGTEERHEYANVIQHKLEAPLLEAQIRLLFSAATQEGAETRLRELAGAFGGYTLSEGNALVFKKPTRFNRQRLLQNIQLRRFNKRKFSCYLNLHEAASVWHLPDKTYEKIGLIDWGKLLLSEPPDDLPVSMQTSEENKREINFFAKTDWRNTEAIFGIKRNDRRKHMYVIGKTGTGKSTLLSNMAINDIRNGEGVAVIDPHGDTSKMILQYIPKRRVNDVVYLDPTLEEHAQFALNLFDETGAAHNDVVASGIVSIFYKLYYHSWGPRLEYILRNSILTLLYYPGATFADIPRLLTNDKYRAQVISTLAQRDDILTAFWRDEFEKMNDRLRTEAISPILNKVGQFLSSQRIRHIVSQQKSSISFEEIMNQRKILIVNLSQGKLGEDTMALLGAMFITKIQLTAMSRVNMPEEERPDFYLYVDEFQNFATHSFIKILSEARKYRLDLILANQYIGQVDEDIQKAIFGNIGSLVSFVVGSADAAVLEKEYGGLFTADELVSLGKYVILLKMAIDELTSSPFMAHTLPLPAVRNENVDKILRVSAERYYKKV